VNSELAQILEYKGHQDRKARPDVPDLDSGLPDRRVVYGKAFVAIGTPTSVRRFTPPLGEIAPILAYRLTSCA